MSRVCQVTQRGTRTGTSIARRGLPKKKGGVGLRISLERAAPFRVDVGFSEDGVNVAARFGLPF